jgi:hypothetical protein
MSSAPILLANALRACSACAGDYEDPERSAWVGESAESDDEVEGDDAGGDARREFPVKEE